MSKNKDEDKELKDIVEESIDELEDEDLEDFDDYEDPDEDDEDDEDYDDDDDDDDDDEEDEDEKPKGKGVSPVILGALGLTFVGAAGFIGATQLGFIGGASDSVIAPMPEPISDDLMLGDPVPEIAMETPSAEVASELSPGEDILGNTTPLESAVTQKESPIEAGKVNLLDLEEVNTNKEIASASSKLSVPASINEEELAQKIEDEILKSEELKTLISSQNKSLTKKEVTKIVERIVEKNISELTLPESDEIDLTGYVSSDYLASELNKLKSELSKADTEVRLSDSEVKNLLNGRDRLKGFVVINKSIDGEMTVVKTPMKRINVYYKGERFKANGKWHTVKSIEDNGHIVLVGDKFFIDEVEEKPVFKPKPKAKAKPKTVEKAKAQKVEPKKKTVNPEMIESRQYRAEAINGKKVAIGYSKNGEYGSGYLIKKKDGEWDTVGKGDIIEGLGKVLGVDIDQNLIVGEWVILNADK